MTQTPLQEAENTWRIIPEFEQYEINLLKDIRYVENKNKLFRSLSVQGVKYYHLNAEPGRVSLMNADHILDVTFPELKEENR